MGQYAVNVALSSHLELMGYPTAYENKPFTPPAGAVFLDESFLPAPSGRVGTGPGDSVQLTGIYQVMVVAPRDGGKQAAYQAADAVISHFAKDTELTHGGEVTRVDIAYAARPMSNDHYFQIPVTVEYSSFQK